MMNKPFAKLLPLILALPLVAGAAETPVQGINVRDAGLKKTSKLMNWKVNLDPSMLIGKVSRGMFCGNKIDLEYNKNYDTFFVSRTSRVFRDRSNKLGYPKFEAGESSFAEKTGAEPDLKIGLSLQHLDNDICVSGADVKGKASVKLRVEVFSNKSQRVVYTRDVEGKFSSDEQIKESLFVDSLLEAAFNQLFSDTKYVDMFREGDIVPQTVADSITVKNGNKQGDSVKKNAKEILSAVVTIENGTSTGSGFYIGREGYIITNQHVVGDAKFVKIKLPGGYSLTGAVLRSDPARDVALIKTDVEPPTAVFVRATPARIGEEVFAIGSPFGSQLAGTLSRGILSAERTLNEQKFVQSDVAINPGNSGGPLVDIDGAIIAVADLRRENASGINMFIPISEALEKLGLNLK